MAELKLKEWKFNEIFWAGRRILTSYKLYYLPLYLEYDNTFIF
jgi:hypothetical protein